MKPKQTRRDFIRLTATGAMGALILSQHSCKKAIPGIGIQLYTIRDAMAADVAGSLKKVADIGRSEERRGGKQC